MNEISLPRLVQKIDHSLVKDFVIMNGPVMLHNGKEIRSKTRGMRTRLPLGSSDEEILTEVAEELNTYLAGANLALFALYRVDLIETLSNDRPQEIFVKVRFYEEEIRPSDIFVTVSTSSIPRFGLRQDGIKFNDQTSFQVKVEEEKLGAYINEQLALAETTGKNIEFVISSVVGK